MTAEEADDFRREIEASLQKFSVPDTYEALNLDIDIAASAPKDQKAVHQVMRIITSANSLSPSPFYPCASVSMVTPIPLLLQTGSGINQLGELESSALVDWCDYWQPDFVLSYSGLLGGKVEAWDPKNSDVLRVKRVLESGSLHFLKGQTERRYYEYRTAQLKQAEEDNSDQGSEADHDQDKVPGYTVECRTRFVQGRKKLECSVPLSLGIRTIGGKMTTLIRQNTVIPTIVTQIFTSNCSKKNIEVFEGLSNMVAGNRKLGELSKSGLALAEPQSYELTFEVDANGVLTVAADFGVGRKEMTIKSRGRLSADEVAKIVENAQVLAYENEV